MNMTGKCLFASCNEIGIFFLNECTKDRTAHLRFLKCSSSEAYIPESLLILNRAGVHIGLVPVDRSLICAKHRHELGIQWKRSKRKCCHPLHDDQESVEAC